MSPTRPSNTAAGPAMVPKYRTAVFLGVAAALLVFDLVLVWLAHHPALGFAPAEAPAAAADELVAQIDTVDATLPRLQERLKGQGAVMGKTFVAEYSAAAAAKGSEPTMEMSQLLAEGLTVITVGSRRPVVLLGDRQVQVGDVLPDGSTVSGIDRHGLATRSAQGATGRLQGFGAIAMPASSPVPSPANEDKTTEVEGSQ